MTTRRSAPPAAEDGPFYASQLRPGDHYELSRGHAIYCSPTGADGARRTGYAFEIIDSDPAVDDAGIDPGFALGPKHLRAPDVAVGVPDAPGWIDGVPPLAIEYAGRGQDEPELQTKIEELLAAGTRWIWVVRLGGPRRVEVYAADTEPRVYGIDAMLSAPGVLQNPVPVLALFDRDAAHEVALKNLLQRRGFPGLEEALAESRTEGREEGRTEGREEGRTEGREEGRTEGREEGQRALIERMLVMRFGPLDEAIRARLMTAPATRLSDLAEPLVTGKSLDEVLARLG